MNLNSKQPQIPTFFPELCKVPAQKKKNHYDNSNMILGSLYQAANKVLTTIKRGAITSLPETFFLTFPDNL